MFKQLFGNYLVEKNGLTKEQLDEIMEKQSATRVKLGLIAVEEQMLTISQADELNRLQAKIDKRFGDIAVEKGYLTEVQVEQLLRKQGHPYLQFIQALTESGYLTLLQIDTYLMDFQKDCGYSNEDLAALKSNDIAKIVPLFVTTANPHYQDIIGIALRNIIRFVNTDFYIGKMKRVENYEFKHIVGQRLQGDHSIILAFGTPKEEKGILELASGYLKEKLAVVDEDAYDAIGEFINCINGLYAAEASRKQINIDMLPPFNYTNQCAAGAAYFLPICIKGGMLDLYIAVDSEVDFESSSSKATKILIVDDSKTSRKVLRGIMEEEGYLVVGEAVNGEDCLMKYPECKPDIVTMDITMPVMDGIEALKQLRKIDPIAKVLMITAAGQQNKIIEAVKAGAAEFLTKPYEKEDVIKVLEEVKNK